VNKIQHKYSGLTLFPVDLLSALIKNRAGVTGLQSTTQFLALRLN
jgi:hypothetical protein